MYSYSARLAVKVSNSNVHNELAHNSPDTPVPQGDVVNWTSLSIAVPVDMKKEFEALARRMRLKPSQYGRMIIADAMARALSVRSESAA